MVSLATKLKLQAQDQAAALHQREAALDSASQGLLKSVQGVQAVVKDTKQAVKRTRRSMFFSFFVLVTVGAVFLGLSPPNLVLACIPCKPSISVHICCRWLSSRNLAVRDTESIGVDCNRSICICNLLGTITSKSVLRSTESDHCFTRSSIEMIPSVHPGVYGFINVTAVTRLFVPYKTMTSQWVGRKQQDTTAVSQKVAPVSQARADVDAIDAASNLEVDLTSEVADVVIQNPVDTPLEQGELPTPSRQLGTPEMDHSSADAHAQEAVGVDSDDTDGRHDLIGNEEPSVDEPLYLPVEGEYEDEDEEDSGPWHEDDGDGKDVRSQKGGHTKWIDQGIDDRASDGPDVGYFNQADDIGVV